MKRLLCLWVTIVAAFLHGCGGNNTIADDTGGGGAGGGGGGGQVPEETVVLMGNGTGAGFQEGMMLVAVPTLAAGGSTSLTVTFVNSTGGVVGSLYTQEVTVTFSSNCLASGLANINGGPGQTATTSTGILTVTYSATGCSGDDVITGTATVNGVNLTATGSVNVASATVGSIEFISADPTKVGLRGTGGAGISETSTVSFRVVDSTGGPVAGAEVDFTLSTTVGGIDWSPQSGVISGADGRVQTVVTSGTVATSVRVTATVVATGISTQSSQLVVTTGVPDQDSTSLAVSCNNIEGLVLDGTDVDVTVRMSDRFNNPVPDGTAVTLTTEGGSIAGSCFTATTGGQSGVCSVTWTSQNPRPANGRSTLLASAIGEESFTDANGNGYFDDADSWTDLDEAFRDDNENGAYDFGEVFVDFNKDFTYTVGDGQFNGLLCGGPGNPGEPTDTMGRCSLTQETLTVSQSNVIIMSGSTAVISDDVGGVLTGTGSVNFYVRDVNGQPMPAGTTISADTSNGNLTQPTEYTVPCQTSDDPADLQYRFNIESDGAAPVSGTLTLTVTTPSGLQTVYFITVND
jgi:hypothetical protein